jgi:hypothetical protein
MPTSTKLRIRSVTVGGNEPGVPSNTGDGAQMSKTGRFYLALQEEREMEGELTSRLESVMSDIARRDPTTMKLSKRFSNFVHEL